MHFYCRSILIIAVRLMVVTSLAAVRSDVKLDSSDAHQLIRNLLNERCFFASRNTGENATTHAYPSLLFKSWKYFLNYNTFLGVVTDVNMRLNWFHVSNRLHCHCFNLIAGGFLLFSRVFPELHSTNGYYLLADIWTLLAIKRNLWKYTMPANAWPD